MIITGRLAGAVVFTFTKTAGFNGSYGANTGFAYLDFSTEGGVDNSSMIIDEIEFQLQGNFNYLAVDNFVWAPQLILPVNLLSYSATLQPSGVVSLNWQTSSESNTSRFIIERSTDAVNFKTIATVNAAGNSRTNTNYSAIDAEPLEGVNYYRLSGFDIDGTMKQLGIKSVRNSSNSFKANIYPNPAAGNAITIKSAFGNGMHLYILADMSGKIIKTGIINSDRQPVNISQLAAGSYLMKLSDGQVIRWVKN
ncbi:MAG: T9SS type A sorting domain-containing protein [Ginsengibacter sp.]